MKKKVLHAFYSFCIAFFSFCILLPIICIGQNEIPIGTWRMHQSYNTISSIAIGSDKVYGASKNGIITFDKTDNSVNAYSKLNGLSEGDISFINFNEQTKQLLVAYADGGVDIIKENIVTNFDRLKNTNTVAGSKRINHISFKSAFALLSTDYGLVVFDLISNEVKETWRDLGVNGTKLKIIQSAFLGDSIFLATEKGIIAGSLNDNLLDYNNWKRFDQADFNIAVKSICAYNQKLFAAIDNAGIYEYESGSWTKQTFLQDVTFRSLYSSVGNLIITEYLNVWKVDKENALTQIVSTSFQNPLLALEDNSGKLWIGDSKKGLVSDFNGNFSSYIPNGPSNLMSAKLKYYNKTIYSVPGGYTKSFQPLNNSGTFDAFSNGVWTNQSSAMLDLSDLDFSNGKTYLSSFGYGIEVRDDKNNVQLFNNDNSPLINTNPPEKAVNISAIEISSDGLWVANFSASKPLHLLKNDNTWQSFSFPSLEFRYPIDLLVDFNGFVWMVLNSNRGLAVFDRTNNKNVRFTNKENALGALPGKEVRSIALDHDGYVWVGTDAGVAYFTDPLNIFAPSADIVKPIFENRFLLQSEVITTIAIDDANRKWIGTENGVWLFNNTGENLIYNFNTENSPLVSNVIRDIEINPETGEVFFATDAGIISFRGDATESAQSFQTIKIFPNPVLSTFNGTVGISGLATNAIVKITDISGNLIWQTQANGGTATWNVKDYNGRRAAAGIYLVFAATENATESIVGKIALVE